MKRFCALLLVLSMVLVPMSAGVAETEKVTLNYFGWTDEQSYMTSLIEQFNAANPDIEIVPTFVNHDDHNTKCVVMASAASTDMDLVSNDSHATVVNLATLNGLMPLQTYITDAGIDLSVFGPIISEMTYNDDYYGLPYRSTLYSLYYNKELFDKMGIAYPEKITWDEYLELARQMTYVEDGTQYWGGFLAEWLGNPTSAYQRGSNLLDDDLTAVSEWVSLLNTAINVDKSHMGYAQQIAESIDWLKFFCTGTTAMLINGEWTISMLKDYENQGIEVPEWDVTYLPSFDASGDVVSPGGLSTFISVGNFSKHKDEAFRFVEYMAGEDAAVYLASQGVLPSYSSDAVKASFAESAGAAGAATLLDTSIMLETPSVAGYSEVQAMYKEENELYLTGQETLEEYLANFEERRAEILDSYK